MRVVIGSDHAGFDQKQRLAQHLTEAGDRPSPTSARSTARTPSTTRTSRSPRRDAWPPVRPTWVCSCAAPASAWPSPPTRSTASARPTSPTPEFARLAREHNNANMVTVSARFVPEQVNEEIVDVFLATPFAQGRHAGRVAKITGGGRRIGGSDE